MSPIVASSEPRPFMPPGWARWVLAVYWVALAVATHWPRLTIVNQDLGDLVEVDKVAHTLAFGLLAYLIAAACPLGRHARRKHHALLALVVALLYAVIDEYTQRWFGRVVSMMDLQASAVGVFWAYLIMTPRRGPVTPRWLRTASRVTLLIAGPVFLVVAVIPGGRTLMLDAASAAGHDGGRFDYTLHVAAALAATLLLAWAQPLGARRPRAAAAAIILAVILAAPVLEVVQQALGRGEIDSGDIAGHMWGLQFAMALWAAQVAMVTVAPISLGNTRLAGVMR